MVVLLCGSIACRKCLHKEGCNFDAEVEAAMRECTPPKYVLLGYKDRKLEDEYMVDWANISKPRIFLGYAFGLVFVLIALMADMASIPFIEVGFWGFGPIDAIVIVRCLVFPLGALGTLWAYRRKNPHAVLFIAQATFLAYLVMVGLDQVYRYFLIEKDTAWVFRLNSWGMITTYWDMPPFLTLFFFNLPVGQTIEIAVTSMLTAYIVIPLIYDGYAEFNPSRVLGEGVPPGMVDTCNQSQEYLDACAAYFTGVYAHSIALAFGCATAIVVVSWIVDSSNRRAFVNRKIIAALTRQRECALLKQKEEQETLINSIFPPMVAKDLIAEHADHDGDGCCDSNSVMEKIRSMKSESNTRNNLGRSVARLHMDVTILFTDIVGFTSMANQCQPYEVMYFLHNLFSAFDELIEMDLHLWKVETVGDAFMVASGLANVSATGTSRDIETVVEVVTSPGHSRTSTTEVENPSGFSDSSEKQVYRIKTLGASHFESKRCTAAQAKEAAARAAVVFGRNVIKEAKLHSMPNGKPCAIRVGAHTGDVCSGVVGNRMPRYCLFGDTVNTANRMESTGQAGRMQISEETHAVVCNDPDFEWECRGEMQVKGKGKMLTYMLVD
ncbi:guanylate cyclase [Chloropicon primus]|nr:guanylate cyclase [Chloropicon primus]